MTTLCPLYINSAADCPTMYLQLKMYLQMARRLHIFYALWQTFKEFETTLPTASTNRKIIATKGRTWDSAQKSALAHSMSHSMSTAEQYYRAYEERWGLYGILEADSVKKMYTFHRTSEQAGVHIFFKANRSQLMPSPKLLVKASADDFPGRKRAKVLHFIGRQFHHKWYNISTVTSHTI